MCNTSNVLPQTISSVQTLVPRRPASVALLLPRLVQEVQALQLLRRPRQLLLAQVLLAQPSQVQVLYLQAGSSDSHLKADPTLSTTIHERLHGSILVDNSLFAYPVQEAITCPPSRRLYPNSVLYLQDGRCGLQQLRVSTSSITIPRLRHGTILACRRAWSLTSHNTNETSEGNSFISDHSLRFDPFLVNVTSRFAEHISSKIRMLRS